MKQYCWIKGRRGDEWQVAEIVTKTDGEEFFYTPEECLGLRPEEIYLISKRWTLEDAGRSFVGPIDDPETRALEMEAELKRLMDEYSFPTSRPRQLFGANSIRHLARILMRLPHETTGLDRW